MLVASPQQKGCAARTMHVHSTQAFTSRHITGAEAEAVCPTLHLRMSPVPCCHDWQRLPAQLQPLRSPLPCNRRIRPDLELPTAPTQQASWQPMLQINGSATRERMQAKCRLCARGSSAEGALDGKHSRSTRWFADRKGRSESCCRVARATSALPTSCSMRANCSSRPSIRRAIVAANLPSLLFPTRRW